MVTNSKYILASSSSSRFKILRNAGFYFKQVNPLCNEEKIKKEIIRGTKSPEIIAKRLSFEKAKSVSEKKIYSKKHVIGCDTIIYLNGKIFDKAKNIDEAKNKIRSLSGKKHKIISGLTICVNGYKKWQCSSSTEVKVRNLTDKEILKYLKRSGTQILKSVGCYQIEALGPTVIEDIKGDYFNVMGLPLFELLKYIYKKK